MTARARNGRRRKRTPPAEPRPPRQRRAPRPALDDGAFGARLMTARRRAGLTQAEMAQALGRDRSLISHLERGHTGKMADILRNVAQHLGVSADYLLGLTDSPVNSASEMRELYEALRSLLEESGGKIEELTAAIRELNGRMGG